MSLSATSGRHELYRGLTRRNRVIAALRVAVPVAGALVLAALVVGIVVGSLDDRFGFASISIDRSNFIVDAPHFSAVAANGNAYTITATEARAAVGDLDTIEVTGGVIAMRTQAGRELSASYDRARLETQDQVVTIRGTATVAGNDGMAGTIADVVWDVPREQLLASGALDVTMAGGRRIVADGVTYDAAAGVWRFTGVEVTLPDLPGAAP
jgi:hypothetical protein